jgi:hypothetical protein
LREALDQIRLATEALAFMLPFLMSGVALCVERPLFGMLVSHREEMVRKGFD